MTRWDSERSTFQKKRGTAMCDGTTSKVPGWWMTFLTAVVQQMPRPDQIDQATAEEWTGNQGALKKVLADTLLTTKEEKLAAPAEKFALLVDLGVITVPDYYVHGTCLGTFFEENGKNLYDFNKSITDANFPNPSRILKPGDKLRVRVFYQIVPGSTTSKERMDFLEKQEGNVYAGVQGASLVFEQKRDMLPKGKWYASFDEAERLWKDSDGDHRVPDVYAYSDGDFGVVLGCLGRDWRDGYAFFSFSDFVESP